MENKFRTAFKNFACAGDTITCEIEGLTITALIEYDNDAGKPDQNDDGFWPNITDKESAGYMGESVTHEEWQKAHNKATETMKAWVNDEWFFVGVILSVAKNDVILSNHAASLWGVECNYPGTDNLYVTQVANELLDDAITEGKNILAKLTTTNTQE